VGATLNADTIPRLACRAVVGSANNQLAAADDAERLRDRGILYAPDFIANGGGALAFGLIHKGERDEAELLRRVGAIRESLGEVLDEAAGRGESPLVAARRRVARVLARDVS
jgi:leucine dehydrogenase